MALHPQSRSELEQHLREQVGYLKASAELFDGGTRAEAKRLAVVIRVLLHDTASSTSLFSMLGMKGCAFVDTAIPMPAGSIISQARLVMQVISIGTGVSHAAFLDDLPGHAARLIAFDAWWHADVFVDQKGNRFSRRALVLALANQDGGAHIDPNLNEAYAALSRDNSLAIDYSGSDGRGAVLGAELAALRQIAHEVLKTIDPSYTKDLPEFPPGSILTAGASVVTQPSNALLANAIQNRVKKVGRNQLCTCGSGRKWKHCCRPRRPPDRPPAR